jgi:F0F1-type ATP synthase assembly protein I
MTCGHCGNILRVKEAVEASRREWAEFPPAIRKEFEEKYKNAQSRYREYELFLKNNRVKHIISGILINITLGLFTYLLKTSGIWFFIYFIISAVSGGLAWLLLNKHGGGAFRGMFLVWGAFMVPTLMQALQESVGISSYREGTISFRSFVFPAFIGSALSLFLGYFFGIKLDFDRGEKSL